MNAQLSSNFESRDLADLAVTRLRRAGIAFSVSRVTKETRPAHGSSAMDIAADAQLQNLMGIDVGAGIFTPVLPFHGYTPGRGSAENTKLSIKVRSDQLDRARDILRSSNGTDIRISV